MICHDSFRVLGVNQRAELTKVFGRNCIENFPLRIIRSPAFCRGTLEGHQMDFIAEVSRLQLVSKKNMYLKRYEMHK